MDVGTFFGQTLSVGAVASCVTELLKTAEGVVPWLKKIPVVGPSLSWLVDTITPEDEASIHIFVAFVCFGLNILSNYMQTGIMEIDAITAGQTLVSFLQANGTYALILKRFEIEQPK